MYAVALNLNNFFGKENYENTLEILGKGETLVDGVYSSSGILRQRANTDCASANCVGDWQVGRDGSKPSAYDDAELSDASHACASSRPNTSNASTKKWRP